MYEDDSSSEGGPKSSFEVYRAEGDVLFKQGEYRKAINSYNTVITHPLVFIQCLPMSFMILHHATCPLSANIDEYPLT